MQWLDAVAQYTKPMDKVLEDFEDAMAGNVRFSTVSATESPTARTARTEQGLRPESQHRETEGRQSGTLRGDLAETGTELRGYETASRITLT